MTYYPQPGETKKDKGDRKLFSENGVIIILVQNSSSFPCINSIFFLPFFKQHNIIYIKGTLPKKISM